MITPEQYDAMWADCMCGHINPAEHPEIRETLVAYKEAIEVLAGIVEIGKRDLRNPKYDGYFEFAREVIAKAGK